MLQCPFCDADLTRMELHEGRCPECGSVLAWNEPDDVASPPIEEVPLSPQPAAGKVAVDEVPPSDPFAAGPPSDLVDTTKHERATVEIDPADAPKPPSQTAESDDRSHGLGPVGFEGDSNLNTTDGGGIRGTMRVEPLSPEQSQVLQTVWASAVPQNMPVRMTIKTGDPLAPAGEDVTVPPRRVESGPVRDSLSADYELIDVIGEGGVGVVYAARQTSVDRTVAVKMLRPEMSREFDQRRKFLAEAIVTGDLDHPNIVPIHELGAGSDGSLFYSMKRVSGTPWSDVLADKLPEENIEILKKVGDAVAFAHSRGVVHRDLKPENVMLGEFGEVMVMDWGIALPTASFHRRSGITHSGGLGGTPAYMAPELATGPLERIGPASDVYLLGGILFEIVTGLTPHTGRDVMECLEAAAANELQSTPKTGELLNIALHAMATAPEDRFPSVQAFQAALREYQSHTESIALAVRAEADLELAQKSSDYQDYARALFAFQEAQALWDGNNRAVLGVSAAKLAYAQCALEKGDFDLGLSLLDEEDPAHKRLRAKLLVAQGDRDTRQARLAALKRTAALLVVVLFVVVSAAFFWVNNARQDAIIAANIADIERKSAKSNELAAKSAAKRAKSAEEDAKSKEQAAKSAAREAEHQRNVAVVETERAKAATAREEFGKRRTEYQHYLSQIALAAEKINGNAFAEAQDILERYRTSELRRWEWARLWFLCQMASSNYDAKVPVEAVAFSPTGDRFVVACDDGTARVWSTNLGIKADATPRAEQLRHAPNASVLAVAWSPDGRDIATAGDDGRIVLWNAESGKVRRMLGRGDGRPAHAAAVTSLRFSYGPAGDATRHWLVSGSRDRSVVVWNVETGRPAHSPLELHSRAVTDVDIDNRQSRIISCGEDGKIVIWHVDFDRRKKGAGDWIRDPKELEGYHNGPVFSVAFSPNGKSVVSGGYDNRVLVWDPDTVEEVDLQKRIRGERERSPMLHVLSEHTAPVRCVAFSPDEKGSLILSSADDNTVIVWDAATGKWKQTLRGHGGWVRAAAFSPAAFRISRVTPQDAVVLSGGYDGRARLWRIAGYGEVREFGTRLLQGNDDAVLDVAVDPQGRRIATAGKDRVVRVWNVTSAADEPIILSESPRQLEEGHDFLASSAVFFRDGKRFLTGAIDGTVRLWDAESGAQLAVLHGTGSSGALALSLDEKWVATGASGDDILLWPVPAAGGKTAAPLRLSGHTGTVVALAFSPDGRQLLSGDSFGRCRVWDLSAGRTTQVARRLQRDGRPLNGNESRPEHSKRIAAVGFLADGRAITASSDNTVSLWNVDTRMEVQRLVLPDSVVGIDLSPDGRRLLVAAKAGAMLEAPDRDDSVVRLVDTANGKTLDERFLADSNVSAARFAGHGSQVLVATDNRSVQRWDQANDRFGKSTGPRSLGEVWTALANPLDGRILTVGGRIARLWDDRSVWTAADPLPLQTFGPHGAVGTVNFSPDGKRLVSAGDGGVVKIWVVADRRVEQRLRLPPSTTIVAAEFSPANGDLLLTAGGGAFRFWKRGAGARPWRPDGAAVPVRGGTEAVEIADADFSPDGALVAVALTDGTAQVWDAAARKRLATLRLGTGRTPALRCIAFSPDGKWIVTGGESNAAAVWERNARMKTWMPLASLEGHPAPVNSVRVTRDRMRIFTASDDKTAKVFDTRDLVERLSVPGGLPEVLLQDRIEQGLDDTAAKLADGPAAGMVGNRQSLQREIGKLIETLDKLLPPAGGPAAAEGPGSTRVNIDRLRGRIKAQKRLWLQRDLDGEGDGDVTTTKPPAGRLMSVDELRSAAGVVDTLGRLIAGPTVISEIFTLRGHLRSVTSVVISPDGQNVMTGSEDGAALLWPAVELKR